MSAEWQILEIERVEAVVEPFDWAFPRDHAAEIDRIWTRETQAKAHLFNGPVLIQHRAGFEGKVFRAGYSHTNYKDFLAWLRMDCPPPQMRNGFSMAALRAADGAYLLGEMAADTANAGKIYFAAGTPDPTDIVDGQVDLAASVLREMTEETGLTTADVTVAADWVVVFGSSRTAFMRPVQIDLPAREARLLMLERMAGLPEHELADIHIVRRLADIDEQRMPPFQQAFLRHALG